MKIKSIKFSPLLFGLGYWKDVYHLFPDDPKVCGYTHNILFPFCRIQFGVLNRIEPGIEKWKRINSKLDSALENVDWVARNKRKKKI